MIPYRNQEEMKARDAFKVAAVNKNIFEINLSNYSVMFSATCLWNIFKLALQILTVSSTLGHNY